MSKARKRIYKASKAASEPAASGKQPAMTRRGPALLAGKQNMQNVVFSAMMALGFWGFAFFCVFFYGSDPNHNLYGGIMALTALIWSFIASRRWSTYRQRASL